MKIAIVGLEKQELSDYIAAHLPSSFTIGEDSPELVMAYGGDGTLLYAERQYPGIPKVMIRNSQICSTCQRTTKDTILNLIQTGAFTVTEEMKLAATAGDDALIGINDIVVAHKRMTHALRAKLYIDGRQYGDTFLGDGIVVSTPLGSTGYYQSITRSNFQFGLGVAFNNSVNVLSHLVIDDKSALEVEVTRGPGIAVADNHDKEILLDAGHRIRIVKSSEVARIVQFDEQHRHLNTRSVTGRVPVGFCQICHKHYERSI